MIAVYFMAVAIVTGAGAPQPTAESTTRAYSIFGPQFRIPCRTASLPPEVEGIELWYSVNSGKTWAQSGSMIRRSETYFEFRATKAGCYLFAARVRYKDGSVTPENQKELTPDLVVYVLNGEDPPKREPRLTDKAEELETELTRVELELIAKEIKRLSAENGLDERTATKIANLRARLREVRERLADRASAPNKPGAIDTESLPPRDHVVPLPVIPSEEDKQLPSTTPLPIPKLPTVPSTTIPAQPPVAPLPRVPEPRS